MKTAQERNAASGGRFYFRKRVSRCWPDTVSNSDSVEEEFCLMTLDEIVNGIPGCSVCAPDAKEGQEVVSTMPGLVPLVETYLDLIGDTETKETRQCVQRYLKLIKLRASGALLTPAAWIRKFIYAHPGYAGDSVVSEAVNYDLMQTMNAISDLRTEAVDFLPNSVTVGNLKEQKSTTNESAPRVKMLRLPLRRNCEEFRRYLASHAPHGCSQESHREICDLCAVSYEQKYNRKYGYAASDSNLPCAEQ
jgi:hypothetical protein